MEFGQQDKVTVCEHRFDVDLFAAVLLREQGVSGPPDQSMPEWMYDGLAFAQANDVNLFAETPEYQEAVILAHIQLDTHWF